MDNLMSNLIQLLISLENRIAAYHATLEGPEWADFDDRFRGIRREIRSKTLSIEELIRWE